MIGMISRVPAIRLAGGLLRLPATMPVGATRSLRSPIAIARTAKLCTKSTPAPAAEEVTGSLLAAVLTTFGTYCIADTLSNFIQHPTQKMDYGFLNQFIGREVDQSFWGTRTEHILGVAACLAVTDHASQALFSSYLGHPLCFASAPGVFIAHTVFFIFAGVAIYVAIDSAMNPTIAENDRASEFGAGLYSTYIGSCTAWFEPFVGPVAVSMFGASFGNSWFGSALLPATLAYATVKVRARGPHTDALAVFIHRHLPLGRESAGTTGETAASTTSRRR